VKANKAKLVALYRKLILKFEIKRSSVQYMFVSLLNDSSNVTLHNGIICQNIYN
jgi:hypothetical protein